MPHGRPATQADLRVLGTLEPFHDALHQVGWKSHRKNRSSQRVHQPPGVFKHIGEYSTVTCSNPLLILCKLLGSEKNVAMTMQAERVERHETNRNNVKDHVTSGVLLDP